MRLIDADAMYERFVKKREGLDGIYDATDLSDMLGDMPTVKAIPIEWLRKVMLNDVNDEISSESAYRIIELWKKELEDNK